MIHIHYLCCETIGRGTRFPSHAHAFYELTYLLEGCTRSRFEGHDRLIRPGQYVFIPPDLPHDYRITQDCRLVNLCFTGIKLDLEAALHGDPASAVRRVLTDLVREHSSPQPGAPLLAQARLLEILGLTQRQAHSRRGPARGLVSRAIALIEETQGSLSVRDLAESLYVSPDYLRHLFREKTHLSPIQHILRRRLETAQRLLTSTQAPLAQVARDSGFSSVYYFSRLFKKMTGATPAEYRRRPWPLDQPRPR